MKPVDFHPEAAEEAREAAGYYDEMQAGLGDEFRTELGESLARISGDPLLYAVESGEIRVCPLHRFPYLVFYEDLWWIEFGWQRSAITAVAPDTGAGAVRIEPVIPRNKRQWR